MNNGFQIAGGPLQPGGFSSAVGDQRFFYDASYLVTLADGSQWLRSGVLVAASEYPQAAKLMHLGSWGLTSSAPPASGDSRMATNGLGTFVLANGLANAVSVSTDGGATWATQTVNLNGSAAVEVVWDPSAGKFIAFGNTATTIYATNSVTGLTGSWSAFVGINVTTASTNTVRAATNGSGRTVAVVSGSVHSAYAVYTDNAGTSFTGGTGLAGSASYMFSVGYASGLGWVIASSNTTSWHRSTLGAAWTQFTGPTGVGASYSLGSCGARLLAPGTGSGGSGGTLYYSDDLFVTWALTSIGAPNGTHYVSGGGFYSIGGVAYELMSSFSPGAATAIRFTEDGIRWNVRQLSNAFYPQAGGFAVDAQGRFAVHGGTGGASVYYGANINVPDYIGVATYSVPPAIGWSTTFGGTLYSRIK